ncbi:hypothetical protein [Alcaligenes faecalis]|uniref:hypothetical protein n=1 Tax=Alcaligenes aquatilis TaxID=323284 RepID=UPI0013EF82AE|nr:hypothetical protein [Alcaligenes faecalis]
MKVKATFSFEHDGTKRRGDVFDVSDRVGSQLVDKGLAVAVDDDAEAGAAPNAGSPRRGKRTSAAAAGADQK